MLSVWERVPFDSVTWLSPALSVKVKVPAGAPDSEILLTPVKLLVATALEVGSTELPNPVSSVCELNMVAPAMRSISEVSCANSAWNRDRNR